MTEESGETRWSKIREVSGEEYAARFAQLARTGKDMHGEVLQPQVQERIDRSDAAVGFFTIRDGRIAAAWGLEDTHTRVKQLGITVGA